MTAPERLDLNEVEWLARNLERTPLGAHPGSLLLKLIAELRAARAAHERLRKVLESVGSCPECRGSGRLEVPCSVCGDSTFDHYCDDHDVPCRDCGGTGQIEEVRAALAAEREKA